MNEFTSLTSFWLSSSSCKSRERWDRRIRTGWYSSSRRSLKWGRLIWELRLHSSSIAITVTEEQTRQTPTTILSQGRHCSEDEDERDRRRKKKAAFAGSSDTAILPELLPAMSGTWPSCRVPPILNLAFLLHFLFLLWLSTIQIYHYVLLHRVWQSMDAIWSVNLYARV